MLHPPSQDLALVEFDTVYHVQKLCETHQHKRSHLADFVLDPRLLQAALKRDQEAAENKQAASPSYVVRLQHLVEYAIDSLDLHVRAYKVSSLLPFLTPLSDLGRGEGVCYPILVRQKCP